MTTTTDLPSWCDLHQRAWCDLCDECGHPAGDHDSAHDGAARWDQVTCWAEFRCRQCAPIVDTAPAEVWCVNDASRAVGVVDGTSYCATCITYASAGQPR